MATQDLLNYTEVDPNNRFSITSPSISITGLARNESAYVYHDFGSAAFTGNFEIWWDGIINSGGAGALFYSALFGNAVGHYQVIGTRQGCRMSRISTGSICRMYIEEYDGTTVYQASYDGVVNTQYYFKFRRDESVGTYGTIYLDIYSNSARTTLITTLSLALHSFVDFQYLYALASYNDGTTAALNGTFANMEIVTPTVVMPTALTGAGTLPAPDIITPIAVSALIGTITVPAHIVVGPSVFTVDPTIGTFTIENPIIQQVQATPSPAIGTFTGNTPIVSLPSIILATEVIGTFVIVDPDVIDKAILIGVANFPSSSTVEYKIVNDSGTIIQDWTSANISEIAVANNKSCYYVKTNKINENFQGFLMWRISGTTYQALELLNIYQSYTDILHTRLTTARAAKLDNVATKSDVIAFS